MLILAATAAALLFAAPARGEALLDSWQDLRDLARVDRPTALTIGPDGNVWFGAPGTSYVGSIAADGRTNAFAVSDLEGALDGFGLGGSAVLPNADGTAWILDPKARFGLWRLADAHLIKRVKMLPDGADDVLTAWRTPGGSIWVADDEVLAQLRPDGTVRRLRPLGRDADLELSAVGPDGRLWLYGTRRSFHERLVKVDESGRAEVAATGEDGFDGATVTWGGGAVVAGDTLWYPAMREIRGREQVVLLGVAAGRPMRQVRLGATRGATEWDGEVTIGAGPGGTVLVADRRAGTLGVLEGGQVRRLATLAPGSHPEEPLLDASGRVWLSLSGGRIAAVEPSGAVVTYADGVPRDPAPPHMTVMMASRDLGRLQRGALRARVGCDVTCGVLLHLAIPRAKARRLGLRNRDLHLTPIPRGWVPLATAGPERPLEGTETVRFKLARGARRALAGQRVLRVRVLASAFDQSLDLRRLAPRTLTLR